MAVQIPQGYIVTAPEAIDNRLIRTKEQMLRTKDEWMPQLYFCLCPEPIYGPGGELEYKLYYYSKDFEYLDTTGRWRPFAGSYEDLSGLPSINGVPILGSEDSGHYHLQNELKESDGIIIDRVDPLLQIIKANIDKDTIKFNSEGAMYADLQWIVDLIDAERQRALGSEANLRAYIDSEANRAKAAEDKLRDDLDSEGRTRKAKDDELEALLDSEAEARKLGDSELKAALDSEALLRLLADSELQAALDSEALIRALADSELHALLDSEAQARVLGDSELKALLDSEALIRALADSELRAALDSEALFRIIADSELRRDLDSEAQARILGDSELRAALDSEAKIRALADSELQEELDSEARIRRLADSELRALIDSERRRAMGSEAWLDSIKQDNLTAEDALLLDSESHIKVLYDNYTIYLNSENELELHLAPRGGVFVDSEGKLSVLPDRTGLRNKGLLIDSEGHLVWGLSGAVDDVVILNNGSARQNSIIESRIAKIRLDNTLVYSEGTKILGADIYAMLPNVAGKQLKALTLDSEGRLTWGEAGKVDGLDVVEGARSNRIPLTNKYLKLNIGDGLDYTSEDLLKVDLKEVLPSMTGQAGKVLTVGSDGNSYIWGDADVVKGADFVEGGTTTRIPLTNKYLKFNLGDGLDYTSEALLEVDLKEVLPNMGGKAGKVLTVGSDGELMWGEADEITNIAVYDGTTLKVLPVVNKRVTVQVERGLQINSEGKIGHINEITPQTAAYAANNVQFYIPKGTDNYGHIVDNAAGVAEGLREVQFLPYDSNVNSWVDLQPATISGRQVVRATQKIKGYNAAAAAGHKYDNATLMLDADGLSANYKSKAQKLVATDATSEQLIIINGNELSLNQLALNRLQLLENAKGVIDSEGLANSKYYPTINLLKTELDAKQDLLTPIAPAFISSEGDSEGPNILTVRYDNNTIILNNRGELKAKDVDLPINGELSEIVPTEASEGNPLVDEDLMYDSLSSNLGIFRGNYDSEGALPDKQDMPDLLRNDYAFITVPVYDSEGNVEYYYNRYKYIDDTSETGHWEFEYRVSGSTFTRYQLNALNSRWNLQLTNVTVDHLNDATIHITSEDRRRWNAKQDALTASDHIDATALAAKRIKVLTSGTTITDATNSTHPIETNAAKAYFKKKQTAVDSNSSTISSEGSYFISRITQNDQGVITPIRTQYTYSNIPNKPQINSVTLTGNKYTEDIIQAKDGIKIDTDHKIAHTNSVTAETTGKGSVTAIPVIKYDAQGHITSVTEATVYPPTTAGTSGQYWISDGAGTGAWTNAYPPTTAGTNGQVWQADGVQAGAWVTPLVFSVTGVDSGTASTNPVTETFRVLPPLS